MLGFKQNRNFTHTQTHNMAEYDNKIFNVYDLPLLVYVSSLYWEIYQ